MVMLILIVVSALGIGAVQISMMGERSARNDRDMQVAWQASEAALMDAEFDIRGILNDTRKPVFGTLGREPNRSLFAATGCSTGATSVGLCDVLSDEQAALPIPKPPKAKWLSANLPAKSGSPTDTVEYGQFTLQKEYQDAGIGGVRPARAPRYVIELVPDYDAQRDMSEKVSSKVFLYRITAMGFGPREDIRAVSQVLLRP